MLINISRFVKSPRVAPGQSHCFDSLGAEAARAHKSFSVDSGSMGQGSTRKENDTMASNLLPVNEGTADRVLRLVVCIDEAVAERLRRRLESERDR